MMRDSTHNLSKPRVQLLSACANGAEQFTAMLSLTRLLHPRGMLLPRLKLSLLTWTNRLSLTMELDERCYSVQGERNQERRALPKV